MFFLIGKFYFMWKMKPWNALFNCFTKVIRKKLLIEKSYKSNKSCKMLEETKTEHKNKKVISFF